MLNKPLMLALAVAAVAAPCAAAADTTVALDPAAAAVTALDGNVVWVSGKFGSETLMQKTATGAARVPGAPKAKAYRGVDLGRDSGNKLVLTYLRCSTASKCTAFRDDLHGHRASIRGLTRAGCSLSTAPALWRTRMAYGLSCTGHGTGLYLKTGTHAPEALRLPHDAVRFGSLAIGAVDLRGTWVGAATNDIYAYAFSETVAGVHQQFFLAAASEGDSDEHVMGLGLAPGGVLWTLVDAEHAGDPNLAVISRLAPGCLQWEQLANPAGPDEENGYRATGLAVDGTSLFLTAPGTGIASHAFAPLHPCPPAT